MKKHTLSPVSLSTDFPALERETLDRWYKTGLVKKYLERNNSSKKRFSFFDGPITANNPMGVHHAWGRTYKDLWQRFYTLRGFKQRYQNGFDCQGLWVEVEVEKELGFKSKKDIENYGVANFVNKCKERVLKYSAIQTDQSKRLGYFMDWDNSYFTMADDNNYTIWHFLKVCHTRGWIYKGHESIPWCPRCETAISQHEILTEDYKEVTHDSIILKYKLADAPDEFLLVWTTTPWTLPANVAIAVDETLTYSLVQSQDGQKLWLASEAVSRIFGQDTSALKTVPGKELIGRKYLSPFDNLEAVQKVASTSSLFHTVIPTDPLIMPISVSEGTGLVHTAVSAGEEDFKLGKKFGLPMIPVIADNADYLSGLGQFTGKNAKKDPKVILDYLVEKDRVGESSVFKIFPYTHRYPACWRCKTELVWKVADEWYIAMDKPDPTDKTGRTLREELVDVAKTIHWLPEFGLDRELDWLKNMHDWLISKKNRYWGLALPIYECHKCGLFEVIGSRDELHDRAVTGWDSFAGHTPHRPWVDEVKIACSNCQATVSRILDVGNPWLDAGIIPFSTLVDPKSKKPSYLSDRKYWSEWFPANFITESFPGQFKNWFYALLVMSTVLEKSQPFKTVLGYASLLAEDGRPMHKSWGNSIEFNEGADKIGVDVVRWMFASASPTDNLLFGYKKADEVRRRFFLTLWNTYNFFVTYALIDNWQPGKSSKKPENILDNWILLRLNEVASAVTTSLEGFDARGATEVLEKFVSDFSTWYIRRSRSRVGPTAGEGADKQTFYETCHQVLITLCQLLAPFMPFVSDEIYRNITGEDSVHLSTWPESKPLPASEKHVLEYMTYIRKVCELGHALRKSHSLKVRQPLSDFFYSVNTKLTNFDPLIWGELIKEELNVKTVIWGESPHQPVHGGQWVAAEFTAHAPDIFVSLKTDLNSNLLEEGEAREIVRNIQDARKAAGTNLTDQVAVTLPFWPEAYTEFIKKETLAQQLIVGDTFKVEVVQSG